MSVIPPEYEEVFTPEAEPAPPSQPEPAPEAEPSPPPEPEPDVELYEGYKVTRDVARQLGDFYDWVRSHPREATEFSSYLQGQYELRPKASGEPEVAPGPDPEEEGEPVPPRVKALEDRLNQVQSELSNQQAVMARTAYARATASFAQDKSLGTDEVEKIAAQAQRMNILPGIAARMQQEGRADAVGAVQEALEAAYWAMPDMRERELVRAREEQKAAASKQRKMAGIGGTSGSVPRERTTALSPEEKTTAMVEMVKAAMEGRFGEGE